MAESDSGFKRSCYSSEDQVWFPAHILGSSQPSVTLAAGNPRPIPKTSVDTYPNMSCTHTKNNKNKHFKIGILFIHFIGYLN